MGRREQLSWSEPPSRGSEKLLQPFQGAHIIPGTSQSQVPAVLLAQVQGQWCPQDDFLLSWGALSALLEVSSPLCLAYHSCLYCNPCPLLTCLLIDFLSVSFATSPSCVPQSLSPSGPLHSWALASRALTTTRAPPGYQPSRSARAYRALARWFHDPCGAIRCVRC